jgi:hypothetical protein
MFCLHNYQCLALPLTRQLLVLPGQGVLLLAGLVQLMSDALDLRDLDTQVTLRCLIQDNGLIQSGLDVNVDLLQMLNTLLQLAGSVVSLWDSSTLSLHVFSFFCFLIN